MTRDDGLRMLDLYVVFRRDDVPAEHEAVYDKVATWLRSQYLSDEFSLDLVVDTLDTLSCDLACCRDSLYSPWLSGLLNMMEVEPC